VQSFIFTTLCQLPLIPLARFYSKKEIQGKTFYNITVKAANWSASGSITSSWNY